MHVSQAELYRALLDLSQSIAGHADLDKLIESLNRTLRRVVEFDSVGLALYDAASGRLELQTVSTNTSYVPRAIAADVREPFPGHKAWHEQRPVVIAPLEFDERWSAFTAEARASGAQGVIAVPLTNGEHRMGLLVFGFRQPPADDEETLAFLMRVASEVAVAVDGYLTTQALQRERDRMRVLFEIGSALTAKLPMNALFAEISQQLCRVVEHDVAVVALLDSPTGLLRLTALHWPGDFRVEPEETTASLEGLPAGEAILTGKPVVVSGGEFEKYHSPIHRRYTEVGFQSSCSVPFTGASGLTGVINLSRLSGRRFNEDEVGLLVQVARLVGICIENAIAYKEINELKDKLATEKLYLEDEIRTDQNLGNMIGESPAFQAVLRAIQIVAPTDATVLVQGETGTGKELIARAIHDLSGRSKKSFIKVNCAAIPATLLESELFGHEKGSFTGAFAQKIGRFELAHQGTLFLDEIGEIPLELQAKLLRALQEQEVERLGGTRTIKVDVRFVAATNRNVREMVAEGKFRSDLYYRLHVFPLAVPTLRERREDIPLLARYFTQKHAKRMNRPIEEIPSAAFEALVEYAWPGNIRELQNVIERSVILSPGRVLQVAIPDVKAAPAATATHAEPAADRQRILEALAACGGKVAGADGAAAKLGLRRTTLQSRMKKLGIQRSFH